MKKLMIVCALICAFYGLGAQITVTNATFPAAGDTLELATDFFPQGIAITPPGINQSWNFTGLEADLTQTTVFKVASEGSVAVPGADLFTGTSGGVESYYNLTTAVMERMAVLQPDTLGLGQPILLRFTPPVLERRAPMTFPSFSSTSSSLSIAISAAIIPDTLLGNLPFTFDSLRIRFTSQRNDFVDAWGTLAIPGGTYDVLREKRTEYRDTRLDVKIPILGWQDVTELLPGNSFFSTLGKDTLVTYNFFSNTEKEVIAVVAVTGTSESVTQVRFKNNGLVTAVGQIAGSNPVVSIHPNPARSVVNIELERFAPGDYRLRLYTVSGQLLMEKPIHLSDHYSETFDTSAIAPGGYIYLITDEAGRLAATGKWMKQ